MLPDLLSVNNSLQPKTTVLTSKNSVNLCVICKVTDLASTSKSFMHIPGTDFVEQCLLRAFNHKNNILLSLSVSCCQANFGSSLLTNLGSPSPNLLNQAPMITIKKRSQFRDILKASLKNQPMEIHISKWRAYTTIFPNLTHHTI